MPQLRALTPKGIDEFRRFLELIRKGRPFEGTPALLFVETTSEPVSDRVRIEQRSFETKFEAAAYLSGLLRTIVMRGDAKEQGLWSWLALFYFEQLAPPDERGLRRPREDYHYIPDWSSGWTRARHLLEGPYRLYQMHGEYSRLLLYPPAHQHGQFIYDLAHRRELISNRGLMQAIDRLYWDEATSRPKRGSTTGDRPGNLRRLIRVVDQLGLNYDLYGMTGEQIAELLPSEFDAWLD